MGHIDPSLSTGMPGLDQVLRGLMPGDNIVWRVNSIDDYEPFVNAACENAARLKQTIVYFRFAKHKHLVQRLVADSNIVSCSLHQFEVADMDFGHTCVIPHKIS